MIRTALEHARTVERPTRDAMLQRAPTVAQFWSQNSDLFQDAWKEWEAEQEGRYALDRTLYDPSMRDAIEQAWEDPSQESAVRALWTQVFPGVYQAQLFDAERVGALREYLDAVAGAEIPLRPPYGIVLNRGGAMLDSRSMGYLAAPSFQVFYQDLMNAYMRPISRLLFPDVVGYDTQTFGFSIKWEEGKDTSLRAHTDASSVTLNINLNVPGEDFSGSAIAFFDSKNRSMERLTFAPGTALIHHGSVPHASEPITRGERHNFVLWLYGDRGQTPPRGTLPRELDSRERWTVPVTEPDLFAPF